MTAATLDAEAVDLGPATALAVGLITAALIGNAWLIRNGYGPLTALAQTPQGKAFRRYFDDHCEKRLAVDLLSIAGRLIPLRRFP